MPGSLNYMTTKYNFAAVPTTYYDGGAGITVGGYPGIAYYQPKIQATGIRATRDLYLNVSVAYISRTQLNIHYEVANRENQAPSAASQPTTNCVMFPSGSNRNFSTQATEPDGHTILYRWAFGNGDSSIWMGPYNSGETCMISYGYPAPGNYNVTVLTKDPWLEGTVWSNPLSVRVSDCQCGDANDDGTINISDAVFLIAYIFASGSAPGPCECSGTGKALGDANGNYAINISDAVYLISYIFGGGLPPHCP